MVAHRHDELGAGDLLGLSLDHRAAKASPLPQREERERDEQLDEGFPHAVGDEVGEGTVAFRCSGRRALQHGDACAGFRDEHVRGQGRVVLRYAEASGTVTPDANPNGSLRGIAGIVNPAGNVLGLMPHPERASEAEVGGTDGLRLLRSLEHWLAAQPAAAERLS